MKRNLKIFSPLIMVLQIFIILFAVMAIPAVAVEVVPPSIPTIMQGSVVLDGEPAPVNTEISVELNGMIAKVMVTTAGEYSNLPVSDLDVGYSYINFYVNGIEATLVDSTVLENDVVIGTVLKNVDLIATSPVDDDTGDDGTGDDGTGDDGTGDDGTGDDGTGDDGTGDDGTGDDGTGDDGTGDDGTGDDGTDDDGTGDDGTDDDTTRSGGGSGSYIIKAITSTSDEEIPSGFTASTTDDTSLDTSLKSVAAPQSMESTEDVVPESKTKPSMMVIVIGAIVLLGIIVIVGYKLKEN